MKRSMFLLFTCWLLAAGTGAQAQQIIFSSRPDNDLYQLLQKEGYAVRRFDSPGAAINAAGHGDALFLLADGYPHSKNPVTESMLQQAKAKQLRIYLEYPATIAAEPFHATLERGVVTSPVFGDRLPPMRILGIHDCYALPVDDKTPLLTLAKVAGFDKAEYGIADVPNHPLLLEKDGVLLSTTKLSHFKTGRYGPNDAWQQVWAWIIQRMTGKKTVRFRHWSTAVTPMYTREQPLPAGAARLCVQKGVEWFYNGRFFIHPSWFALYEKNQGDGTNPVAAPLGQDQPNGDGSMGLLEGHSSKIYHDGSQQYRYWIRADVQGEAAMALAAAGRLLNNDEYRKKATALTDYIFAGSNLRAENRNDTGSPSFGLIGWAVTHPFVYYGDDNARAILGILAASAFLNTEKWNRQVVEGILANFRTTGQNGFRGNHLRDADLQKNGWQHYAARTTMNYAPHFESWMWAIYLWLYDKTGYQPLFDMAKNGIRHTMAAYPSQWRWTNGIQQERARMILPLAWLVRVDDTPQHRQWLDEMVREILKNQDASGAIREELGESSKGVYGRTKSNKDYGLHEAPLIFHNGDPVADMLYTSNFAFFALNEAAHATGNAQYKKAVAKLADFLIRIQVKSDTHKDMDGGWFRAFEYRRWEYWADNADAGWGAWGTLSGWTQSWIVTTEVFTQQNTSFWELTRQARMKPYFEQAAFMLKKN